MNKMIKREILREKIKRTEQQISKLKNKFLDLRRQDLLLSDKVQQFVEEHEINGRGKNKRSRLVGRVFWDEDFEDKGTGEFITIKRSIVVRVDGEWC